ncbi:hypothetical protein ACFYOF_18310 [Streptomyces sp. NPDC007148]|uniref:hypothetical protein n=1 Tax=Streptomyces sp. NPDC007148 TaxID=3364775 RepID=UPI003695D1E4
MRSRTALPSTAPDLTSYDLLAPQLSGGKDSAVTMAVFMEAARVCGVDDRVISYHTSLGVLEWPPVVCSGIRYPGVSELAALQSAAFGVPANRHLALSARTGSGCTPVWEAAAAREGIEMFTGFRQQHEHGEVAAGVRGASGATGDVRAPDRPDNRMAGCEGNAAGCSA